MAWRRVLPFLFFVACLLIAACASSSSTVASNALSHPEWLVGDWQAIGWQVGAGDTQFQRNVTVTFTGDGNWKASGGGSGTSWLEGDQVMFTGITSAGENFQCLMKRRQGTAGPELIGVVNARAGATELSLKKLR